jgi:hypothetical protein
MKKQTLIAFAALGAAGAGHLSLLEAWHAQCVIE